MDSLTGIPYPPPSDLKCGDDFTLVLVGTRLDCLDVVFVPGILGMLHPLEVRDSPDWYPPEEESTSQPKDMKHDETCPIEISRSS